MIHARADDFKNAQFGFYWSFRFYASAFESESHAAKIYYLTAKLCDSESTILEDDLKLLEECNETNTLEIKLLRCQLLLCLQKWPQLEAFIESESGEISFENVTEIILRSSSTTECPLGIHHKILQCLLQRETENIERFASLYRAMCTCSLLIDFHDRSYFMEAIKIIKMAFGKYPGDEVAWLCNQAHTQAVEDFCHRRDTKGASEWIEIALSLLYLIPTGNAHRPPLEASIKDLYARILGKSIS